MDFHRLRFAQISAGGVSIALKPATRLQRWRAVFDAFSKLTDTLLVPPVLSRPPRKGRNGLKRVAALAALALGISAPTLAAHSIQDRLRQFGDDAAERLRSDFNRAGVPYPPGAVTLLVFKREHEVQTYAAGEDGVQRYIRTQEIEDIGSGLGPKLRQGDEKIPEGFYGVDLLNPNSAFYVSLHVTYPNAFDRARAAEDGRQRLGGSIMFHGHALSSGCVVVSNQDAEDLFTLANDTGLENLRVIISPVDFRHTWLWRRPKGSPAWTRELYQLIKTELKNYPAR